MAVRLPLLWTTGTHRGQEEVPQGSTALECHAVLLGLLLLQEGACGVYGGKTFSNLISVLNPALGEVYKGDSGA